MTEFLSHLISRNLNAPAAGQPGKILQPRLPSLFEAPPNGPVGLVPDADSGHELSLERTGPEEGKPSSLLPFGPSVSSSARPRAGSDMNQPARRGEAAPKAGKLLTGAELSGSTRPVIPILVRVPEGTDRRNQPPEGRIASQDGKTPLADNPGLLAGRAGAPTVRINIGRIEVRAIAPQAQPPAAPPTPHRPRLSLDEYLHQQDKGRR
jgi:hypothetical protein